MSTAPWPPGQATTQDQPKQPKRFGCMKLILIAVAALVGLFLIVGLSGGFDRDEGSEVTTGAVEVPTERERDLVAQAEEVEGKLDPFFEGCEWEHSEPSGTMMSVCHEHELGIIVGSGPSSVSLIADKIGEDVPVGGYVTEGSWAVWSSDRGNVNMAWDVLGASGERVWF